MAILKRTLLALLVLLILGYFGATWYVGSMVESAMTDDGSKISAQLPLFKISERKFERGFFHSRETAKVSLDIPGGENIRFELESNIKNGPFPGFSGIAAAVVDSTLTIKEGFPPQAVSAMNSGLILTAHTIYKLDGQENESHITMPGFNATILALETADMKVNFSGDFAHYSFRADFPKVELRIPGGLDWTLADFHYEGDLKQVFSDDPTLYAGSRRLTVGRMMFNPIFRLPTPVQLPSLMVKEVALNDNTTMSGNEFMDYAGKSSIKSLEINTQDYGPARMDMAIGHMHARTLAEIIRMNQGNQAAQSPVSLAPQMAVLGQDLMKQGMTFRINQLSFTTPQGEASLQVSLSLTDPAQANFADQEALAKNINVTTSISMPEEFLRSLPGKFADPTQAAERLDAFIEDGVGRGYVTRNGTALVSKVDFRNGQLSLNDIPYVASPPQPANEMPALAKTMGCAACHALDRKVVGPAWRMVSKRYRNATQFEYNGTSYPLAEGLIRKVSLGGSRHWGPVVMPPNDPTGQKRNDIAKLVQFILALEQGSALKH